jgi:hypothetical protein
MPKTNDVARIQNEDQYKLTGHLQQRAENSMKQADHDTQSVHSQKEAQKTVISGDQKGRNENKYQRNKEKKKSDGDEADSGMQEKLTERHTIDIRL